MPSYPLGGANFSIFLVLFYNWIPFVALPIFAVLENMDHRLIEAVRADDDASFHRALGEVTAFVKAKGATLPHDDVSASAIILPSDDMSLSEVTSLLQQENWMGEPAAT